MNSLKHLSLLAPLTASLGLLLGGRLTAQTFTTLHTFTGPIHGATGGTDGAYPFGGLTLSGNTLYGTTREGGSGGRGTVFAVNTDGTGFKTLYSFTAGGYNSSGNLTNSDGASSYSGVVLLGSSLYGTAQFGGAFGSGTIFKLNIDGTGFTNLYNFTALPGDFLSGANSDGGLPRGRLAVSGDTLYGIAFNGGRSQRGTAFKIKADGSGFVNIHDFSYFSDGANPVSGLIVSGNTLYGTAPLGGSFDFGSVFAVNTDGSAFSTLHSFGGYPSDGASPQGSLLLSGDTLYGTTWDGGKSNNGAVFSIKTNGMGYTILHDFPGGPEGDSSAGAVILWSNRLYGSARTVFSMNIEGSDYLALYDAGSDQSLVSSANTLYGTTSWEGVGKGTVFSLAFSPQLGIIESGASVILMWPTNYAGFDYSGYILQSSTNLVSPVWSTNSTMPVILNGQYTVTNPISGTQQFFRLKQ